MIIFSHASFSFSQFFFLNDLSFFIPPVITRIFISIAEACIVGILTKEAKAVNEMHLVTVEINISKCSI